MKAVDDILVKDVEVVIIVNGEVIGQEEAVRDDFNARCSGSIGRKSLTSTSRTSCA